MRRHPAARSSLGSPGSAADRQTACPLTPAAIWRWNALAAGGGGALALALAALGSMVAPGALAATASTAIVSLPPSAGRIVAVEESGAGGDLRQRIVLSGGHAGANAIQIMVGRDAGAPSAQQINAEVAEQFPGVAMTPLPGRMLSSAYGPMHIAIGAPAGGGRCLYAWQQVKDLSRLAQHAAPPFQRVTPASLRIRLCSKTATLDQLAEMSEQVVIGSPGSLSRVFGEAPPPLNLSPLYEAPAVAERQPRVMLAQASGRAQDGALLDHSSGNPGGLIGLMRGYRRNDPVQVARPVRSLPRQASRGYTSTQTGSGFGYRPLLADDGPEATVQRAGLLDGWLARRRMEMRRNPRNQQPPPRVRRQVQPKPSYAPSRRAAPRPAARPVAKPKPAPAPRRQAAPPEQRVAPQQAAPVHSQRPVERQAPGVVNQPAMHPGYQAPGGGARYLGPAPGAAPAQPAPSIVPGAGVGGASSPQVPRPVQGGPGAVSPPPPSGVRDSQPALRGLDPTLPGRAYRGPGG